MGRSNFDWVVVFDDGSSLIIENQITPMKVLDYIIYNHPDKDIDDIINIVRLELSSL